MGIGLGKRKTAVTGDFWPLLKFSHGMFYVESSVRTDNGWEKVQENLSEHFRALFDCATALVGWGKLERGQAPVWHLKPVGEDYGQPPDKSYQEGFKILAKVNGTVCEFSNTSVGAWNGLHSLVSDYQDRAADYPGQVPEVELEGVNRQDYPGGITSWEPIFRIVGWAPRPPEFGDVSNPPHHQKQRELPLKGTVGGDVSDEIPF
jgi:hypothetical protein